MITQSNHIHFIGIGGSGISAIARWMNQIGKKVSGSDQNESNNLRDLRHKGILCYVGHKKEQMSDTVDTVIFSQAIEKKSNPEYLEAEKRGLKMMSYFEALGQISKQKKTIVVVGTHGKTTTTAMLGQALLSAEVDTSVVVGSRVPAFENTNLHVGKSDWLVVEGCEYRRSFLYLQPFAVVFLNCEAEHLDYYKDEADYESAFEELINKIPEEGFLIYNEENELCKKIAKKATCKKIGTKKYYAKHLNLRLKVIGDFNLLNATHAYLAAKQISLENKKIKKGLESFTGTQRRLEAKGEKNGVQVIDDYAHHPTEIKVTLKALSEAYSDKRIICVFQPHQYSRTHQLLDEFEDAFVSADLVMIPSIYEARDTDEDKAKINPQSFVDTLSNYHPNVEYSHNFEQTAKQLINISQKNDLIITMGAGDVYKVGEMFLEE